MGMTESVVTESGTAWLNEFRQQAKAKFETLSWPDRKTENWRYAFLSESKITPFLSGKAPSPQAAAADVVDASDSAKAEPLAATKVVFENGVFRADATTIQAEVGVDVVPFSAANEIQRAAIVAVLEDQLARVSDKIQALGLSVLEEGIFIKVSKETLLENPIHVQWVQTAAAAQVVPQVCVFVAEQGAQANLIEQYIGEQTEQALLSSFTYMSLEQDAHVQHYALQQDANATLAAREQNVVLHKQAALNSFQLGMGAEFQRKVINIFHRGEHCESHLNGVYLPTGKEIVDFHTCLEHEVPNTRSNEVFRGIVNDQAKAVFNGRIHIHRDAQKTAAMLSNKNLLTSDKAEVNTKPELEIYADDVQCAHGATVAQLDDEALHYLKTRGVPEQEALVMLSYGFINALVEDIKLESVRDYIKPLIANVFAKDAHLKRHLS